MNKYYPPIYINYILEKPDKTLVKVSFYQCSVDELKLASKEGRNAEGSIKKQKVYELPKMTADEAREEIYSKLVKEKVIKKIKVPEQKLKEL